MEEPLWIPSDGRPTPSPAQALKDRHFDISEYVDTTGRSMRYLRGFPIATEVILLQSITFNRMQFPESPDRADVVMTLLGLDRASARPIGFTGKLTFTETNSMIVAARQAAQRIPLELR